MGNYLNPLNTIYQELINSEIMIDKSLLIEKTNQILNTTSKYICLLRPRRFGKSTDANMLVAYYSQGCDSHQIFDHLKISQSESYPQHLNQHNVIHLNMQYFLSMSNSIENMINILTEEVMAKLIEHYSVSNQRNILSLVIFKIFSQYKKSFIFIIDEWNWIFRNFIQIFTFLYLKYIWLIWHYQ